MELQKPMQLLINAMISKKDKTKIIYTVGKEYSYTQDGDPIGKGVFYDHKHLMQYIRKTTKIELAEKAKEVSCQHSPL